METPAIIVIIIISIIAAIDTAVKFFKKHFIVTEEKAVTHRRARPKFIAVVSHPKDDREKEVDRLLKRRNLSLAEQQYIYDFLVETGKEKWRYIKGYEGYYRINTYGVIESCRYDGRFRTPSVRKDGAYTVGLSVDAIQKNYPIHQLVAQTFIPNPTSARTVKPKDGNYANCDVRNLVWRRRTVPKKRRRAA